MEKLTLVIALIGSFAWVAPWLFEKINGPKLLLSTKWVLPVIGLTITHVLTNGVEKDETKNLFLLKLIITSINKGFDLFDVSVMVYSREGKKGHAKIISMPHNGIRFGTTTSPLNGLTIKAPDKEYIRNMNFFPKEEAMDVVVPVFTDMDIEDLSKIEITLTRFNGMKEKRVIKVYELIHQSMRSELTGKVSIEERYIFISE